MEKLRGKGYENTNPCLVNWIPTFSKNMDTDLLVDSKPCMHRSAHLFGYCIFFPKFVDMD
jgi:hypothetical protein